MSFFKSMVITLLCVSSVATGACCLQPFPATNFQEIIFLGRQESSSIVNHALNGLGGEELVRVFGVFPPLAVQEMVKQELDNKSCPDYQNLFVEVAPQGLESWPLRYAVRNHDDVEFLMRLVGQDLNVDGRLQRVRAISWYFITKRNTGDRAVLVQVFDGGDKRLKSIKARAL